MSNTHLHSTQNTAQHDQLAFDLYNELKESGLSTKQYRKSIALVAAMKLKCHQPDESLDILSIYDDIDVNIRYVRMMSLAYLNQFDQVFRLLQMTCTEQAPKIPDQLVKQMHMWQFFLSFSIYLSIHPFKTNSTLNFQNFTLQLHKIEKQLRKLNDENLSNQYETIFNELKRLDKIFFKVRKSASNLSL